MYEAIFLLVGYVFGSIPTGYLAVRLKFGRDIRSEGSGKTGGFNTFTVTRSRYVAVGVGLFDALKGFAVAWTALILFPDAPNVQAAGIIGALLGHNYPVWLRFKGGRGLATVAGALFAVGQFLLIFWCLVWLAGYLVKKDIMIANLIATILSLIATWSVPPEVLSWFMIRDVDPFWYASFISIILVVLLVAHQDGIRSLISPTVENGERSA